MRRLFTVAAAISAAGVALIVTWNGEAPVSQDAITVERAVAASVRQWPAPGTCVLMEATVPGSVDGGPATVQRPYEICSRIGAVESPDAGAYYEGRIDIECRNAARDLCGLSVDAGESTPAEQLAAQHCSQQAQDACRAATRTIGVAPGWMSEQYAWVAQPAIRLINRPGAIWRAHGCVCKGASACKYWPHTGEDAGVSVPPGTVVPAATATVGCIDAPCVETEARESSGCDWQHVACGLPVECR